jgi:hypothetical protein
LDQPLPKPGETICIFRVSPECRSRSITDRWCQAKIIKALQKNTFEIEYQYGWRVPLYSRSKAPEIVLGVDGREEVDLRKIKKWGPKASHLTTLGIINETRENWFFLKIEGQAGFIPLPCTPHDTLVVGREHTGGDLRVDKLQCVLTRYHGARKPDEQMPDNWGLKFVGINTGLYWKSKGRGKGTRGVREYSYKLHVGSSFSFLADGSFKASIQLEAIEDMCEPGMLMDVAASEMAIGPNRTTVMAEADRTAVAKRSLAETQELMESAGPAAKKQKLRHTTANRRFLFPLKVGTIAYKLDVKNVGHNLPVVLRPKGGAVEYVDILGSGCNNVIARLKTGEQGAYGYGSRWGGGYGIEICQAVDCVSAGEDAPDKMAIEKRELVKLAKGQECLLEYASRKTAFLSLRTSVSDSIPAIWSLANHSLFPAAFQEMTMQLLLARQRLRQTRKAIGSLNDHILSGILRFLSHDHAYTGGADTESSRLMIDVYINDRMVQPQVDADCTPTTVLWSKLHDPKHIGAMLSYLPYSTVLGQPVLLPVCGRPSDAGSYGYSTSYGRQTGEERAKKEIADPFVFREPEEVCAIVLSWPVATHSCAAACATHLLTRLSALLHLCPSSTSAPPPLLPLLHLCPTSAPPPPLPPRHL